MPKEADERGLAPGKLPLDLLERLLATFPAPPPEVILGAGVGEDACAVEVGDRVLVAAADPITLTSEDAGRLAVFVNANDVAVSGARPRWFLAVVLVPPGASEELLDGLFRSIHAALDEVGAHLVGGHTEVTPAVTRPVVIGQMLGIAEHGVVATSGFGPGERVIQVKPAPIEGAAVLARHASGAQTVPFGLLREAEAALERPGVSVVAPALLATELGATALHDPTEGGLAGGLHELASASGQRIVVDRSSVLWFPPGIAVCEAVGADPWATLASGTLLATFPEALVSDALVALRAIGCEAAVIARGEPGSGVVDRVGEPLLWPDRDEVARLVATTGAGDPMATI